jgi:tetratricopeptide (TPR) repeat protein
MTHDLTPEAIQGEVDRILASEKFARSKRLRSLLRFTVAQTLQGNAETLKEYVIGTEVLKKPDSYDPRSDSLVRVLASRLRVKLKEYYRDGGEEDPLVIEFPKGKYVPRFQRREQLQSEVEKKLKARNLYSHGRYMCGKLTEAGLSEGADHFRDAIDADPTWPMAPIGLASAYAFQAIFGMRRPREMWPQAKAAAEAALQLDEMSAEAHICLGMEKAFFEWRWRDADSHFQRAIERDAYSGAGHLWRAIAYMVPMGRLAAARDEIARARELAPSTFIEEAHLLTLYLSEQYEDVLRRTENFKVGSSVHNWAAWMRGAALSATGQQEAAVALLKQVHEASPADSKIIAALGYCYAIAGQRERAQEMISQLRERREAGAWVPHFDFALIQTGLGNRNDALVLLNESLREREPWMVFLTVDPRLGSLRTTPKFTSLVRRVLLSEAEIIQSRESVGA